MFKTIVAAYDGSDHAKKALRVACDLAQHYDAVLHIGHTPEHETPAVVVGAFVGQLSSPPTAEEIAKAGEHIMEEARGIAEVAGIKPVREAIGVGDAAADLVELARASGADLIVMGRRGLGTVGALTLGSVSAKVAHDSPCACLTVK